MADSFGQWLKQRRKALDLTQSMLAQRVGCSMDTIRKIEADERRPSQLTAERLAACLALSSDTRPSFVAHARAGIPPLQSRMPNPLEVAAAPLDWQQMAAALDALRRGDFAPHLPAQPPGSPAAVVVSSYKALVLHLIQLTAELTRVVREVGYDSRLGCQAGRPDLEGRWRDLQDDVNEMAEILTRQVRYTATTVFALAQDAPAPRIPAEGRGEMRALQEAVNRLVEQRSAADGTANQP